MLVDKHPYANPRHIEPVEEILNAVLSVRINFVTFLEFENSLGHRLYDIRMPVADLHQCTTKPG
jgi:hypothetical protein